MDNDLLFLIILISMVLILGTIGFYYTDQHKKEVETWDCKKIKERIIEQGDSNGFYFRQLLKHNCPFQS